MTRVKDILTAQGLLKGTNAVPKPLAQSITLCQPDNSLLRILDIVVYTITSPSASYKLERVLLDLMLSGGLRISEVLGPGVLKVNMLGQVFIQGSKGSDNKLVTPIHFKSFWVNSIGTVANPFMHISRFSFYKWLRKNEISIDLGKNGNNKVTHSLRHLHVYLMELMNLSEKEMSEILGHKNIKNIKYYLHGKN